MGLISRVSSRTYRKSIPYLKMPQQKIGFFEDFMLAGVSAGVSKTATAPIERVKLLIQNQDEMIKQGRPDRPYTGVVDCTKRVLAEEGVGPFWRGNMANVLRYFPTQALNFAFKEQFKSIFAVSKDASYATKTAANIASGGCAGTLSLMFVYSLDFARTRLANDAKGKDGKRQFNGLIDVYKQTLKSDGVAGLYRGFVISAVGIFVYRGFYFGLYDTVRPMMPEGGGALTSFAVGYAVTVSSGLASYPIDTIRRRMMMTSGQAVKYKGSMDCTLQILRNEGIPSFFKGAGANILRGMAGAGTLAGFDEFKKAYTKWMYPATD